MLSNEYTNRVDEATVLTVPEVEGTETWVPVHHGVFIDNLNLALESEGLSVVNKDYSQNSNGMRMFGVWQLQAYDNRMAFALGLRNAMDKSMALGITAGTRVFVCDNLTFSGDFIQFRRHTKHIFAELFTLCREAVAGLTSNLIEFAKWHDSMRSFYLSRQSAQLLTFKAIENNIIAPSRFRKFHGLYFDEKASYGTKNDLWSWHEAVTELMRDSNLFTVQQRNAGLNRICQYYIDNYRMYTESEGMVWKDFADFSPYRAMTALTQN